MCASVNDQRSLHGGVYSSGLVYSAATMYFQRVTKWDNFQKCDGYRIREHTISQSMVLGSGTAKCRMSSRRLLCGWDAEGMEEAEVQWPVKGKGKGDVKIWHCVLLPQAGKTDEDIRLKQFRRPMDQQKSIGPKLAKKCHTTVGKQQLAPLYCHMRRPSWLIQFMRNSHAIHVFIHLHAVCVFPQV